jgi:CrcB protein
MTVLVTALAGSVGAACRYWLSGAVQRRGGSAFPVGTMAVNLIGAFALGFVIGGGDADALGSLAAAGFLGGFTTFSTWMVETIRLGILPRPAGSAAVNALGVAALGIAVAAIGYHLSS